MASHRPQLFSRLLLVFFLHSTFSMLTSARPWRTRHGPFDYGDALSKSILFFEAQRSGFLPPDQRVKWRSHSGLHDGRISGVDLVGGYYDAGDNVKFGLPMAFTITMLSWSVVEYKAQIAKAGELGHALEAIKWGTDYLLKAHPEPSVLWVEVGDGNSDHLCWQRPEDMTTPRQGYRLDTSRPGSDVAGETAAAMAAASIAFKDQDRLYSGRLLAHAKQLFTFADNYRGKYDDSVSVARNYYASGASGYNDELLWAAAWLYLATDDQHYLDYLANNADKLGGTGWAMREFSWDVKYAGVQVLATKILLEGKAGRHADVLQEYHYKAEYFACACLRHNSGSEHNVERTPAGLMYVRDWNNMQYVTAGSFLLTVYGDYLAGAGKNLHCPGHGVSPHEILAFAQFQANYILGQNPRSTSYMVGFGPTYPQQTHHRASSIVSIKQYPNFIDCKAGYGDWYSRKQGDPNVLVGAVVGGPDQNDNFRDDRHNWEQTEPATYNNGPLVGILARFHGSSTNRLHDAEVLDVSLSANNGWTRQSLQSDMLNTSFKESEEMATSPSDDSVAEEKTALKVAEEEPIAVTQEVTDVWESQGSTHFRYGVKITNKSKSKLQKLVLRIKDFDGQQWGLSRTSERELFTFPPWLHELAPEESFTFVYTQDAPAAEVTAVSFSKV